MSVLESVSESIFRVVHSAIILFMDDWNSHLSGGQSADARLKSCGQSCLSFSEH